MNHARSTSPSAAPTPRDLPRYLSYGYVVMGYEVDPSRAWGPSLRAKWTRNGSRNAANSGIGSEGACMMRMVVFIPHYTAEHPK